MPRYRMTRHVPRWVSESVYVIADDEDQAKDRFHQGYIEDYGDSEITDKIKQMDSHGLTIKKLFEHLTSARVMREIIRVRDYWAKYGAYGRRGP